MYKNIPNRYPNFSKVYKLLVVKRHAHGYKSFGRHDECYHDHHGTEEQQAKSGQWTAETFRRPLTSQMGNRCPGVAGKSEKSSHDRLQTHKEVIVLLSRECWFLVNKKVVGCDQVNQGSYKCIQDGTDS